VPEQLGHSSFGITADTHTSVMPAVAHAPPEAVARIVPRRTKEPPAADAGEADVERPDGRDAGALTDGSLPASREGSEDDRERS
jgi:hypothetical protein